MEIGGSEIEVVRIARVGKSIALNIAIEAARAAVVLQGIVEFHASKDFSEAYEAIAVGVETMGTTSGEITGARGINRVLIESDGTLLRFCTFERNERGFEVLDGSTLDGDTGCKIFIAFGIYSKVIKAILYFRKHAHAIEPARWKRQRGQQSHSEGCAKRLSRVEICNTYYYRGG